VVDVLYYAWCLEVSSEPPLARAVAEHWRGRLEDMGSERGENVHTPEGWRGVTGMGVEGTINKKKVAVGNRAFMELLGVKIPPKVESLLREMEFKGQTAIMVSVDGKLQAICGISDQLKPDSALAVRTLQSMGVQCWMVTGDNERTAHAIGEMVGIPKANIVSQALPETKVREVSRLQGEGRVVAMVGDGINDSPALVQADVGIAIGAGTEIAVEAASVVLVRSAVSDVVVAIELSRAIFSRIKLNFVWALGYNTLMIPVAAGAMYPWWRVALPPWLAGLAMALSSVSVVLSSLHLKLWNNRRRVEVV
jgi:Cu+-exporting ATPase